MAKASPSASTGWTFFSNHSHVLFCLARDPEQTLRGVAEQVGITERAVQRIVAELEQAGVIVRRREGRRNRYSIDPGVRLRHAVEGHCRVADLLELVVGVRTMNATRPAGATRVDPSLTKPPATAVRGERRSAGRLR
jgi:DNA-binding Lrp family transcriptional regulator